MYIVINDISIIKQTSTVVSDDCTQSDMIESANVTSSNRRTSDENGICKLKINN